MAGETVISINTHALDNEQIRYDQELQKWVTYERAYNFYRQTAGDIEPTLSDTQIPLEVDATLPSGTGWTLNGGNLEFVGRPGLLWSAMMMTDWSLQMNNNTEFAFAIGMKLLTGTGTVNMIEQRFPFQTSRGETYRASLNNLEMYIQPDIGDIIQFYCRDDTGIGGGTPGIQLLVLETITRISTL